MPVVGRDADGSRTVRESAGAMLGRFASTQAAQRFAQGERRDRTANEIATSAGFRPRISGRLSLRNAATLRTRKQPRAFSAIGFATVSLGFLIGTAGTAIEDVGATSIAPRRGNLLARE